MTIIEIFIGIVGIIIIFFVGCFVLGAFMKVRDAIMHFDNNTSQVKIYTPLVEVFKSSLKQDPATSVNSKQTRNIVLFAWVVSSFLSLLFLPIGSYSLFPNIFDQFQIVAIFGLLMVYPIGIMVLNSLSVRKNSIHDLRYLSEDVFSNFISFLIIILSIMVIYNGGYNFAAIPTIDDLIIYQESSLLSFWGITVPSIFGLVNPFALVAFFAIIPSTFRPFKFGSPDLMKKWDPIEENYTGKSLSLVKMVEVIRFMVLIILFVNLFLAGGNITTLTYIDILVLVVFIVGVAILLAFVKSRRTRWILDRKVASFIKVHNLVAIAALAFSLVLVM